MPRIIYDKEVQENHDDNLQTIFTMSITGQSYDSSTAVVTTTSTDVFDEFYDFDNPFGWLISGNSSKKSIWQKEAEIEEYRQRLNKEIEPHYELHCIGRMIHAGRDHRDYYHLYKNRSF